MSSDGKRSPLSDEKLEQLEELVRNDYPELADAALRIVGRLRWYKDSGMPEGQQDGDLLQEAITLVLTGQRRWPDGVKPFALLHMVMESLASHLLESPANREVSLPEARGASAAGDADSDQTADFLNVNDDGELEDETDDRVDRAIINFRDLPGDRLLRKEAEEQIVKEVLDAVVGDERAEPVVRAILVQASTPRAIAEETGLEIRQVYRELAKLKTQLIEVAKKWRNREQAEAEDERQ